MNRFDFHLTTRPNDEDIYLAINASLDQDRFFVFYQKFNYPMEHSYTLRTFIEIESQKEFAAKLALHLKCDVLFNPSEEEFCYGYDHLAIYDETLTEKVTVKVIPTYDW
jgi:hypothetical protein